MATTKKPLNLGFDDEDDDSSNNEAEVTDKQFKQLKKPQPHTSNATKKRVNPFLSSVSSSRKKVGQAPAPKLALQSRDELPGDSSCFLHSSVRNGGALKDKAIDEDEDGDSQTRTQAQPEEEEDDYMSMTLPILPASHEKETYTQLRLRKQRESEIKGRTLSKAELARLEKERRDEGLQRSLLEGVSKEEKEKNRGYKLMKAMGWREEGGGLGKRDNSTTSAAAAGEGGDESDAGQGQSSRPTNPPPMKAPITEPIALIIKEDRSGIGHLTSEKKKFSAQLEKIGAALPDLNKASSRPTETAESYRERIRQEREEKRKESQFYKAQKILEEFDTEDRGGSNTQDQGTSASEQENPHNDVDRSAIPNMRPITTIPLLYRSLVKHRESIDRARKARYEFLQSLSSVRHQYDARPPILPGYEPEPEEKLALGQGNTAAEDENDLDEAVDEELEEFNKRSFAERLELIVGELREKWNYCFWCKWRYGSIQEMGESCPGVEEDLHG